MQTAINKGPLFSLCSQKCRLQAAVGQGREDRAGPQIPLGHYSGCHSGIPTPLSRRHRESGGGPEIPGRSLEVKQTGQRRTREEQEEDRGTQRSQEEEETQDNKTRETGPKNGRRGTPTRKPPQED
ncbi:hypothetical protein NDU88_010461 [Pleurodeles waltl]|uniref:Uncharacterized protein n=1 Tax=Pleurodeles waltl TaxID=8319 RepID=A0AAV7RYA2_PLEWA|nr:hypothetical protein NDU88_010461 [Pleurodeles waltl]